jgi:hypothetical protein
MNLLTYNKTKTFKQKLDIVINILYYLIIIYILLASIFYISFPDKYCYTLEKGSNNIYSTNNAKAKGLLSEGYCKKLTQEEYYEKNRYYKQKLYIGLVLIILMMVSDEKLRKGLKVKLETWDIKFKK